MGFFDKFLDAVRLNDDYDDDDEFFDDDDEDYDDEPEEEPAPKKKHFGSRKSVNAAREAEEEEPVRKSQPETSGRYTTAARMQTRPAAQSQKVTPMHRAASSSRSGMEVCVIKPAKVEDYREIADTLLSGCTVVLNLEGLDVELAQRIIDFSSGSCYAIGGGLQKVSSYIFILTPSTVEISGDIQDLLNGAMPTMRTAF
ncbi:cell division protein SepF [Bilifractor sp. HCP3S3_D3]|uniref:cell division protein SepF n=1 Tax=Bilifractor sp. HCP3S3_D3 TaxID=3438907 RepID=UPI003F89E09A